MATFFQSTTPPSTYTLPNCGNYFTEWSNTQCPPIVQGKISPSQYHECVHQLNRKRRIGRTSTLIVGMCYGLFYLAYFIFYVMALNQAGNVLLLPSSFVIAAIFFGCLSLGFTLHRVSVRKNQIAALICFYNDSLFHPNGLHLQWDRKREAILTINSTSQPMQQQQQQQQFVYQVPPAYGSQSSAPQFVPMYQQHPVMHLQYPLMNLQQQQQHLMYPQPLMYLQQQQPQQPQQQQHQRQQQQLYSMPLPYPSYSTGFSGVVPPPSVQTENQPLLAPSGGSIQNQ